MHRLGVIGILALSKYAEFHGAMENTSDIINIFIQWPWQIPTDAGQAPTRLEGDEPAGALLPAMAS